MVILNWQCTPYKSFRLGHPSSCTGTTVPLNTCKNVGMHVYIYIYIYIQRVYLSSQVYPHLCKTGEKDLLILELGDNTQGLDTSSVQVNHKRCRLGAQTTRQEEINLIMHVGRTLTHNRWFLFAKQFLIVFRRCSRSEKKKIVE